MIKKILVSLLILLIFNSCSKEQFKADIPSYLHISSIDLQTEPTEGSDSSNFTDAWLTMDGEFLGVFELPATVPILADGIHDFRIYAGIKANGISATRIRYPFLEVCDLLISEDDESDMDTSRRISLYRDSTIFIKALTRYSASTNFLLLEDYEGNEEVMVSSEITDTNFVKVKSEALVYEGASSAAIFLDDTNSFFEILSSEFTSLNTLYHPTMLELNYRCDHPFRVGVVVKTAESNTFRSFVPYQIKPSADWNKIYIDMTYQINLGNSSNEFGIFISAEKSKSIETASFYFDNIKWLHKK